MRNEKVVATCGCICELSADYNWVDESICDVEINIVEIVCDYHRNPPRDTSVCLCGGSYYQDKVLGEVCCRCQSPRKLGNQ